MPLESGHRLGPYEVVSALGAGGMGEVYRARDTRLGRDVAVKVLSPRLARDERARARFEREARAIAALSHPNILAIYDVGEENGVSYAVTELLEGETLGARLGGGALAYDETGTIARQIVRGLAAAHDRGLVHRDLKPENVFLTRAGHVKLLDFGLAKMSAGELSDSAEAPTVTSHTHAGAILGTVGYMSPEQARGQTADHRSDLFSFGAVLYEMISGRRAFSGASPADTISAILREEPPELGGLADNGADALEVVARRCLRKKAGRRFSTAREVEKALDEALRRPTGALPAPPAATAVEARGAGQAPAATGGSASDEPAPSVAVLPFADMSPGKDQDYFCEGMAEEIMSALGAIEGLRVAARTSTFRFKGKTDDIRAIGDALGVTKVLEGGVRTAGTRLRVTARLVNVADGYRLWSERFDREMEDVFAIQDEISEAVVDALRIRLAAESMPPEAPADEKARQAAKPTRDIEAYHLYLKGRHARYSKLDFRGAARHYEDALDRDPGYAAARAGLAEVLVLMGTYGQMRPKITVARAETELEHALALEGESAPVCAVQCLLRATQWDFDGSLRAGRRAIELDPGLVVAHAWYGMALAAARPADEALAEVRKAVELDPLSPYAYGIEAFICAQTRRFDEGVAAAERAHELDPDYMLGYWTKAYCLSGLGRHDASAVAAGRGAELTQRSPFALALLAMAEALAGRQNAARLILDDLGDRAKREYVAPVFLARVHACLGEADEALDMLERAADEKDPTLIYQGLPGLESLAGHERHDALLRRMGVPRPAWS